MERQRVHEIDNTLKSPERRNFLKALTAISTGVVAGCRRVESTQRDTDDDTAVASTEVRAIDYSSLEETEKIEYIREALLDLIRELREKIDVNMNEQLALELERALAFFEEVQTSSVDQERNVELEFDSKMLEQHGADAAFTPGTRVITLSEQFDPNNLIDMFNLLHEVLHAEHHVVLGADESVEAQMMRLIENQFGTNIYEEASTMRMHIEALNAYLDSAFKNFTYDMGVLIADAQDGIISTEEFGQRAADLEARTVNELAVATNSRPEQREAIAVLLEAAFAIYISRNAEADIPRMLIDLVARLYNGTGVTLHEFIPPGSSNVNPDHQLERYIEGGNVLLYNRNGTREIITIEWSRDEK